MAKDQRHYTDVEREAVVRRVRAGESRIAVAAATGIPESTVNFWVQNAENRRRHKDVEREEVVRRVQAGESRNAVAAATGIPPSTVGYWVKIAGGGSATGSGVNAGKAGKAEKSTAPKKASRPRASSSGRGREAISWALDGDVLVVRIPLSRFAGQLVQEALAEI